MTELLASLTEIVEAVFGWIPDVAEMYVSNPILLLSFGIFLAGAAIGLLGRLFRRT